MRISDIENFVVRANSASLEPYSVKIPAHVKPYTTTTIKKADVLFDGTVVHCEDAGTTFLPLITSDGARPHATQRIDFYGKGFGFPHQGISVDGQVLYWRSDEQQEEWRRRQQGNFEAVDLRTRQTFTPNYAKLHEFTFKDDAAEQRWAEGLEKNSTHPYNFVVFEYCSRWAQAVEHDIDFNHLTLEDVAEKASNWANEGCEITGYQYGCAVSILADVWKHGEALRRWHNNQYGVSPDKEGVVNPAILSVATGDSP